MPSLLGTGAEMQSADKSLWNI